MIVESVCLFHGYQQSENWNILYKLIKRSQTQFSGLMFLATTGNAEIYIIANDEQKTLIVIVKINLDGWL